MDDIVTQVQAVATGFVAPQPVTRAEYAAISCNRCGRCCEDIPAPESPEDMAAIAGDPAVDDDVRAFAAGLVPVRPVAGGWSYRCRHFGPGLDGAATCQIYDRRPSICRRFPDTAVRRWMECAWYVRVEDDSEEAETDWQPVVLRPRPPTDPVAARLEALYKDLPADERVVMDYVLRRAVAHLVEASLAPPP